MRCVFVSPEFPPAPGGVGDHVSHLVRTVAAWGIEPLVLTSVLTSVPASARPPASESPEGVAVHAVVRRWDAGGAGAIAAAIRALQPEVVNLHYSPYLYDRYGIAPWLAGLPGAVGVRWVTTFHEVAVRIRWASPRSWPLGVLQRRAAGALTRASSALVLSLPLYRSLLPGGPPAVEIPPGSNVPPLALAADELTELRATIARPDEVVVVTFGAAAAWRRTDLLLQALARVRARPERPAVRLLVLGDQAEPGSASRRALDGIVDGLDLAPWVRLTGRLSPRDVFAHLCAADLFALFDSDPYGGVSTKSTSLAAAFAAGLPVLGNRGRLTDPILVHDVNVHLVDTLRVDVLAQALLGLITNPDVRRRLAQGSRETYRRHLAWDVLGPRYAEILRGA